MEPKIRDINNNSIRSFFVEMLFNNEVISSGTAFIAKTGGQSQALLITNRHNVTGRNNDIGEYLSKTGGIPNKIKARIPNLEIANSGSEHVEFNSWRSYTIDLYFDEDFEQPVWIEHPLKEEIDVVGIILNFTDFSIPEQLIYDISPGWYSWEVGETINVVGFPFGLSVNRFPVWMTGHIASEPDINYDGLPMFLIDCRTRRGQSGSPVIGRFLPGRVVEYKGEKFRVQAEITHLIGIYSGRINSESDLGKVWKTDAIRELLLNGIQAGKPI
ncbi:MAG: hypothetical protein ACRYFR_15050 [Janthinobacterium lividum]